MRLLVTGGAGYIGSHTVDDLLARGDEVVVVDDLSTGDARRIDGVPVETLDLRRVDEQPRLARIISEREIEAVVHFAAKKRVQESVARPADYALANVGATAVLLEAMRDGGCRRLVFSSTAAVYGEVDGTVDEEAPARPVSPYGWSKLAAEELIAAAAAADGLSAIALRYFNVAGARSARLAEPDAENLIPQVIRRLRSGERPQIFGDDYPTDDGTCVRDFVHADDVSAAHLVALDALGEPGCRRYNVGTGAGASVAAVVRAICDVEGIEFRPEALPRRAGDPAVVVADVRRIRAELGWSAMRTLDDIVASAVRTTVG